MVGIPPIMLDGKLTAHHATNITIISEKLEEFELLNSYIAISAPMCVSAQQGPGAHAVCPS